MTAATGSSISTGDSTYWIDHACPSCGAAQIVQIGVVVNSQGNRVSGAPAWYRCPACHEGAVRVRGTLYPPSQPLREPLGLPEVDKRIWGEARTCLGVGAHSAAVMLCRKLLFHVAVAHGLPAKNENDRAPTYWAAVEHLQSEGLITAKMRPWVDRIKDVGNDANHEVNPIDQREALDVATFTEQLLVLAYEMDALMTDPSTAAPELA